ncbi:unnamed protein product (macronuclear) [Paramecium tetraurelia]|uniref:Vesicle-fusing ATPase n=1 Tax=Paramecium tetraurelia TaxID=5888 RepID=A0C095_PARTE|nr:uncharacterized protein GSPATT00006065001 [Paramecium tetraurelia]CAK64212.1 unnamed protein product [Paramecium tetraurelia]|eukprot:XP_001431610.1 hypothetical protein (macronuclear) [Paramecium tetraurelia strain d4-2]
MSQTLVATQLRNPEHAYSGLTYGSKELVDKLKKENKLGESDQLFVIINGYIFVFKGDADYRKNEIGANKYQRELLKMTISQEVEFQVFKLPKDKEYRLKVLDLEIDIQSLGNGGNQIELDDDEFAKLFKTQFRGQFFKTGQVQLFQHNQNHYLIKVTRTENLSVETDQNLKKFVGGGMLFDNTEIEFSVRSGISQLKMKNVQKKTATLFKDDFNFDQLGVGGLDKELADIFRRAFSSRRFSQQYLEKYGIKHIKGLLLYGPPGTGKTLIARQLANVLRARPPKIVNGPEIFSKYVGEAEENIRKLFADAIKDQETLGDESDLHIIVFDEMDAICKQRGSVSSGVGAYDNVVNQLLSMIDGVNSLNNILVIGMTNRKDLIDEAVLRPGRFEVHIEVGLPDEKGRQQIFQIHTENLRKNQALYKDVNNEELATLTKNYTGAEIEAVVKSASSFAFQRIQNIFNFSQRVNQQDDLKITRADFQNALEEVKPQFGFDSNKFDLLLKNQLIDFGDEFQKLQKMLRGTINQTRFGKSSKLNSILLEGYQGSGKTSVAAYFAVECGFPYVKLISPECFIGMTEDAIINKISKIFNDAYKSSLSCIVIDNIERLIEYVDIGPRFSNSILQALLVLIKRLPDKTQNKLMIVGTTSSYQILKQLGVVSCFNLTFKVPNLSKKEEIRTVIYNYMNIPDKDDKSEKQKKQRAQIEKICSTIDNIPIKRLLMLLDMVCTDENELNYEEFKSCYQMAQMNHS